MDTRSEQELYELQSHIFKTLSSSTYDYTTLNQEDKTARILELVLNWIACEMEKSKLEG